jgi:FixJ family two-component response regulator
MSKSSDLLISIIDDDASLRRSVGNLLRSVGFRAEACESAEAFLEQSERLQPACLVLDIRMPGMTGLDLLAQLAASETRRLVPTVILTACDDEETRRRSMAAGAVAFLKKPFRPEHLIEAVKLALVGAESG